MGWVLTQIGKWCVRHADRIITRAQKTPYFNLPGYMDRWWLLKPHWWTLHFGVRVHRFMRSDTDRALHDHPGCSLSILLRGAYTETMPVDQGQHPFDDFVPGGTYSLHRVAGDVIPRSRRFGHRLTLNSDEVWSIFVMRHARQAWGFRTREGWVWWREYCNEWEGLTHEEIRRVVKRLKNGKGCRQPQGRALEVLQHAVRENRRHVRSSEGS